MDYFISDLHIGHHNVIIFENRPFKDIDDMTDSFIKKWNAKVKDSDTVYILGDFIWKTKKINPIKIVSKLKGKKVLIKGNHDTLIKNKEFEKLFESIHTYLEITVPINKQNVKCILCHYFIPFYNHNKRNGIMLHGHSHMTSESIKEREIVDRLNNDGFDLRIFNVGCMYPYMNYEPQTLEKIILGSEEFHRSKNSI